MNKRTNGLTLYARLQRLDQDRTSGWQPKTLIHNDKLVEYMGQSIHTLVALQNIYPTQVKYVPFNDVH